MIQDLGFKKMEILKEVKDDKENEILHYVQNDQGMDS